MKMWLFFGLMILQSAVYAQIKNPVKWDMSYNQVSAQEFDLVFTATINSGWYVYSQFLDDGGPIPTSFNFETGDHFQLIGKAKEESANKKAGHDAIFDMQVVKYAKKVTFTQRVKASDLKKPIVGYLTFMTCDDEQCLPPTDIDYRFELKSTMNATQKAAPDKQTEPTKKTGDAQPKTEIKSPFGEVKTEMAEKAFEPSGVEQPVKWRFESKKISDTEYDLRLIADIEKGWTVYAQDVAPNGPVPTSFLFEKSDGYVLVGPIKEEGKKKSGIDPFFKTQVSKFIESPAIFTQRVQVSDPSKPVVGNLEFMACNDVRCLAPETIDFNFNLSTGMAAAAGPVIVDSGNGKVIDQTVPTILETYKTPVGNCGEEAVARGQNLMWTFLLGFIGGLLALLTPCVFPMIPLTVSFFTKSSKDRKSGLRNALLYGFSIIAIYVAIGLLITAVFGATALNELSTNWIANTLFFVIFLAFAFSFFGYYEITLPSSWSTKSDALAEKGGFLGTFFMAFTLALVSFSCTGPIIGSAIVQSATSTMGPFTVMLGFSTALAIPFALFAAFPAWLQSLPRSGSWMNSVKVVLGFLELALALKFLSVADMTMHWNILPYEVFMGLWVLIFGAMTAYLFGLIRFPHDSPMKKLSPARGIIATLSLVLTAYLASGFMIDNKTESYGSLSLMSGLAPPAQYNFFLTQTDVDPAIKTRYPSFSKCANNLDCFKDYYEGMAYAKEVNRPVLLDFTGYGCVNCRKTEEHIWVETDVWNKLAKDFVLISLYVDDRKPLPEILISKLQQTKIRNVGNKWADFQIVNFEQNSQPLYVMMSPDERVLAAPRGYQEGVESYVNFLKCGENTFQNTSGKLGER
ncbi:MAG: cytochrome c biogenesis protein CcdA [Saprospiraceae bacterium]|nr:cytochrome c biogenesis protein CcdA [Saprospiraceae bacterium]